MKELMLEILFAYSKALEWILKFLPLKVYEPIYQQRKGLIVKH